MESFITETGQRVTNVHSHAKCAGERCIFHSPTDHSMRGWQMHMRETGLVERICTHGIGHPDPDSAAFMDRLWCQPVGTWSIHGCDGCCGEEEV